MKSLFAILLLSAATALAADPLMVQVSTYARVSAGNADGTAPEPALPGTILTPPAGGWPASYDAMRETLGSRRNGRFNVMIDGIYTPKPLSAEQSAAFFIPDLQHAVEVKSGGEVLLPNGKYTTIELKPGTTMVVGATDEQYYVAIRLLPPADARDDAMVIWQGEKPLRLVSRVEPKYPSIESMRNTSGIVLTQIRIESDGSVSGVTVLQKVQPQIEAAAVEALKKWRFEPATRNGKPVAAYMMMATNYRIE